MEYPIALEAYQETKSEDIIVERKVVHNEIEANSFQRKHAAHTIVTKPLTAEELADPRIR